MTNEYKSTSDLIDLSLDWMVVDMKVMESFFCCIASNLKIKVSYLDAWRRLILNLTLEHKLICLVSVSYNLGVILRINKT